MLFPDMWEYVTSAAASANLTLLKPAAAGPKYLSES